MRAFKSLFVALCVLSCLSCELLSPPGDGDDGPGGPPGPAWPGKASYVRVGYVNTCAVATNGTGYCWGTNASSQLTYPHELVNPCAGGDMTVWPCIGRAPIPVTGGGDWKTLTYGYQGPLCGVRADDKVECFAFFSASNSVVDFPAGVTTVGGTLMCGSIACYNTPLPLKGGGTFKSFDWGFSSGFACGLTTTGTAMCVGANYQYGSLGSGTLAEVILTPRAVAGTLAFTQIAVALTGNHVCGLIADGTAYCWGDDANGRLGYTPGAAPGRLAGGVPYPIAVQTALKFKWISAGGMMTCGVTLAGAGYCWGAGAYGNGSVWSEAFAPMAVAPGKVLSNIEVGVTLVCGVDTAGDGWCWGQNNYGQLGIGSITATSTAPSKVLGGHTWKRISPGHEHACGITTSDVLYCWGRNDAGQLGVPSLWVGSTAGHAFEPKEVGK